MRLLFISFLLSTLAFAEEEAPPEPSQVVISPWEEMSLTDLNMVYNELKINSPGTVDSQNTSFKKWLDKGFEKGKELSKGISSFEGYKAVIFGYMAGFEDPHVKVELQVNTLSSSWPGFMLSYENDQFVVSFVDKSFKVEGDDLPAVGDVVLEIDGTPTQEVLKDRVFKYQPKTPELEASIVKGAPFLLIDDKNPFEKVPSTCLIDSSSKLKKINLHFTQVSNCQLEKLITAARQKPQNSFGTREFLGEKGTWVSIPSFFPKTAKAVKALTEIVEEAKLLRDKEVIVLDLRGNEGGNSGWGSDFLENLYGKPFFFKMLEETQGKFYTEFRVSKDNLDYIRNNMIPMIKNHLGPNSDILTTLENLADSMEKALEEGKDGLVKGKSSPSSSASSSPDPLFHGTLVVLTDSFCASSCLTFVSQVLAMPNAIHVGRETGNTTVYSEVRTVPLPSKLGQLMLPMKVFRNREKGFNGVYTPAHRFEGSITDTVAIEAWIKNLLEEKIN